MVEEDKNIQKKHQHSTNIMSSILAAQAKAGAGIEANTAQLFEGLIVVCRNLVHLH